MSANQFEDSYDLDIKGVSYIGNPKPYTAMYVSKKIERYLDNLKKLSQCLVFVETGIKIPKEIEDDHVIVQVDNPQLAYAKFAGWLEIQRRLEDKKKKYIFNNGSYISETAHIGDDVYIAPGCWIGHDVIIGNNSTIMTGTIINHSVIGEHFYANEYAVIGSNGFTMAKDDNGDIIRIPSLGNVVIGNHVEIGVHDNISRGSAGDTILEDNVKLDANVYIGHDAVLGRNVEVTAGAIVGGFDMIKEDVFLGLNATLRNRILVGKGSVIGMGAVILKDVEKSETIVGNPGRKLIPGGVIRRINIPMQSIRQPA